LSVGLHIRTNIVRKEGPSGTSINSGAIDATDGLVTSKMDHFEYKNGILHAEDVAIPDLVRKVGTPFYCYSSATLKRHYHVFADAFAFNDTLVCFSVKSNSNLAIIKTLGGEGAGADIVSAGELHRALAADIPPNRIVFSGVGKSRDELSFALETGILQFNVESIAELEALNQISILAGKKAPVALRVNPDVDAGTHQKISTGKAENKFGIPWSQAPAVFAQASKMDGIDVLGIDVHIGSQITDLEPFATAFAKVVDLVRALRAEGHKIHHLDLGGGLGIPYKAGNVIPPNPSDYAGMIKEITHNLDVRLLFEPGRMIVGNAGILVTSVIYQKTMEAKSFLILDAAMNDLVRPTLYDAHHDIIPVHQAAPDAQMSNFDVVGPVCETGDIFASNRPLPPLNEGDPIAILSAGAYGAVLSNTYNSRPLVPEVLVNGDQMALIRPRQTYQDLLALDQLPAWL
jgi:diaminopimelate decarboxylase